MSHRPHLGYATKEATSENRTSIRVMHDIFPCCELVYSLFLSRRKHIIFKIPNSNQFLARYLEISAFLTHYESKINIKSVILEHNLYVKRFQLKQLQYLHPLMDLLINRIHGTKDCLLYLHSLLLLLLLLLL